MQSSRHISFAGWNAITGKAADLDVDIDGLVDQLDSLDTSAHERGIAKKAGTTIYRRPIPTESPEDPVIGRWALVVLEDDAERAEEALRPLIERRVGQGVAFDNAPDVQSKHGIIRMPSIASTNPERWLRALKEVTEGAPPYYLLLVGGPRRFSFDVQIALEQEFATGRLDPGDGMDGAPDWDACHVWADKLVRYESGMMEVERQALLYSFATDDATRRSHTELSEPLGEYLDNRGRRLRSKPLAPKRLFGPDATTARLCEELGKSRPALVITASHGLEWFDSPTPRDDWGALTDESFSGTTGTPLDAVCVRGCPSFALGAVMVSFACFSAGVPGESVHRLLQEKAPNAIPGAPYTSSLPRTLLAHPMGPVAFVGHVDRTTSESFQPRGPAEGPAAFIDFVQWSLGGQGTLGQAMSGFRDQCGIAAQHLANTLARARKRPDIAASKAALDAWIRYHDAAGYILLGDPVMKLVMA